MVRYFWNTTAASLVLLVTFMAGCGDFEWFPKDSTFSNNSTVSVPATKPGTVMRAFAFPDTVKWVSDVAYDQNSNSFWLLAWTSGAPPNAPNALVNIDATTGAYLSTVDAVSWPFTILDGSTLVHDGISFWITSNGSNSGVAAKEVYQILANGMYLNKKFNCPANNPVTNPANDDGFCRGLAFDAATSSYWSAGSDNSKLVNYQLADSVVTSSVSYSNSLFAAAGDVAFDSASGEVFVVKNGIIRVNSSTGAYLGSIHFKLPGTGRGDWDGTNFWVVDNSSKSIKALFVR